MAITRVKRNEKMRFATVIIMTLALLLVGFTSCGNKAVVTEAKKQTIKADYKLATYTYKVKQGDTLDEITSRFMGLNTYGDRNFYEFKEGIKERNPQAFVNGEYLRANEVLVINVWTK